MKKKCEHEGRRRRPFSEGPGECEPWATQIKDEIAELFELVSHLIIKKLIPAVEKKGELVK